MRRQAKAVDFNLLNQGPNAAKRRGSVRPRAAGVLIARRLQPQRFPERSRLLADFTCEGGFVANQGDSSLVMPRPMGAWPPFKVQSSHFPGRAFIGPNPEEYLLNIVSEWPVIREEPTGERRHHIYGLATAR
jgi:hypothetical protein